MLLDHKGQWLGFRVWLVVGYGRMTMKRLPVVGCSILVLVLVMTVCGCTPSGFEPGATLVAEATPTVTIQSKTSGVEETQLIQLDNCDGKANLTRTEQRSQTIDAEISAEVAAQIGASAQVIYGDVQAAVGMALAAGNARGTSIELAAPPGTKMEFQLIWIGDEEVGVVQKILNSEIPIAFRSFSASDVRIKSQYDLGCPSTIPPVPTRLEPQDIVPTTILVNAEDIMSQIRGEDGELQRVMDWWREDGGGATGGLLDPISNRPNENCYGLAWNTREYGLHSLLVFQQPTQITFVDGDGGWHVKVCVPTYITISLEDVGRIQADWLQKRYGMEDGMEGLSWEVIVR